MVTVRVREDDLRLAIGSNREWYESLEDAALSDGYGKPDASTMRAARAGMAASVRLAAALRVGIETRDA